MPISAGRRSRYSRQSIEVTNVELQPAIVRYVLMIGDIEEAVHIFLHVLGMTVMSHEEFNGNIQEDDREEERLSSQDDRQWSRTIVGFQNGSTCIQLTLNYGIESYSRGNLMQAIELQVSQNIIQRLKDAGFPNQVCRGHKAFIVDCDGYQLRILKSPDERNRVRRVILNCDDSLSFLGRTVSFWTTCLGFRISGWSSDPEHDKHAHLLEYVESKYEKCHFPWWCRLCCCAKCMLREERDTYRPLRLDEEPYIEFQYGDTQDFFICLQRLPVDKLLDTGTSQEKIILSCTEELQTDIILQLTSFAKQPRRSSMLVHNVTFKDGVVCTDSNGLEFEYHLMEDLKTKPQRDAEQTFREFIKRYKGALEDYKHRIQRERSDYNSNL